MRLYKSELVETYRKQERIAWLAVLSEVPNLVASVITAYFANTLVCWADSAGSLETTMHCLLVALISRKMKKETADNHNYGMDRLEVFVSFICDAFAVIGMGIVLFSSFFGLVHPQNPSDSLLLFLLLKCINVIVDLYFLLNQRIIYRRRSSKLNESELKQRRNALISDAAVGIVVCVCYFYRSEIWVAYLSPLFSILMGTFFILGYIRHIEDSVMELSDAALPLKEQDQISQIVLKHTDIIRKVDAISSHRLNRKVFIDLELEMPEETTYAAQKAFLDEVNREIDAVLPGAEARLVLRESQGMEFLQ